MLQLNLTSIDCIKKLKVNHVLRVACGLMIDEIPSVAMLYNFMYRIVGHEDRPATKKFKKKPSFKLIKGEKLPPNYSGITRKLKDKLFIGRRFTYPIAIAINEILAVAVRSLYEFRLINPIVNISGDGMCILTGASTYGKKTCGCKSKGIYN